MIASLLAGAAWAAQVDLDVDTTELRDGQTIGLTVTVSDAQARGIPTVPAPDGLTVDYRSQSQNRLMINFNLTTSTAYRYALTATRPGDYTVGPITVATTSGTVTSDAVKVHVSPRGGDGLNDLVADIGTDTAWVGQVVTYHLRFETDKQLVSGRWGPPDGPGITPEPGVEPGTTEYQIGEGSTVHTVSELFYPLRFGKPGALSIPGGIYRAQFAVQGRRRRGNSQMDGLFDDLAAMSQVTSETYSASPLQLTVRDLPSEGRPPAFGGLVGTFSVSSRVSATEVAVGDTVTVEVDVTGDAPLAGFALPPLQGSGFRVYDDQPATEARLVDGHVVASAHYKRAVVPEAAGDLEIPGVSLVSFDPTAGRYVTTTSDPIRLHVSGSASGAQVASFAGPGQKEVGALADDILPGRTGGNLRRPLPGGWAGLLLVPGAALLVGQVAASLRRRPTARAERPYDFADLPADPEGRLAGLDRIFRERAAAKLGIASAALRRDEVARLGPEAEAVFRELEELRYRGAHGALPEAAVRRVVEAL